MGEYTHNHHGAFKKKPQNRLLIDICSGTRVMAIFKKHTFGDAALIYLRPFHIGLYQHVPLTALIIWALAKGLRNCTAGSYPVCCRALATISLIFLFMKGNLCTLDSTMLQKQ